MAGKSLRFAIMGSGGVGGYFGAALVRGGFDTTFVARGAHLKAMQSSGLHIEAPDVTDILQVSATDNPGDIGPVDFVLFSVKLWDTKEAAEACLPLMGRDTAVISLQNGIDSERILGEVLGSSHVMGGVAEISATISEPGTIKCVSPFRRIRFGELDNSSSKRTEALTTAFEHAEIDHNQPRDINAAIWTKFTLLVGLSAMTALTRRTLGEVREDEDTRALMRSVMQEVVSVAQATDIAIPDDLVDRHMKFIDSVPGSIKASMAIDLDAGRRLELPWLSGAVVRLGKELKLETPANGFVCTALKLDQNGAG